MVYIVTGLITLEQRKVLIVNIYFGRVLKYTEEVLLTKKLKMVTSNIRVLESTSYRVGIGTLFFSRVKEYLIYESKNAFGK